MKGIEILNSSAYLFFFFNGDFAWSVQVSRPDEQGVLHWPFSSTCVHRFKNICL